MPDKAVHSTLGQSSLSQRTIRQTFNRRLSLLLAVFSLVMSAFFVLAYQHQTDKFNRGVLANTVSNLLVRIKDQGSSEHLD